MQEVGSTASALADGAMAVIQRTESQWLAAAWLPKCLPRGASCAFAGYTTEPAPFHVKPESLETTGWDSVPTSPHSAHAHTTHTQRTIYTSHHTHAPYPFTLKHTHHTAHTHRAHHAYTVVHTHHTYTTESVLPTLPLIPYTKVYLMQRYKAILGLDDLLRVGVQEMKTNK